MRHWWWRVRLALMDRLAKRLGVAISIKGAPFGAGRDGADIGGRR